MKPIVRLQAVSVKGLKNISEGSFSFNSTFDSMSHADVIGIYGQNGSGKTGAVEALALLKILLDPARNTLDEKSRELIMDGAKAIEICYDFLLKNEYGEYSSRYQCEITEKDNHLHLLSENLTYRENLPNKRHKSIAFKSEDMVTIRNTKVSSLGDSHKVDVMYTDKTSREERVGFIFNKLLRDVYHDLLTAKEYQIIQNISVDFNNNFHIIECNEFGLILSNIMMPVSVHIKNKRGALPYTLSEPAVLSKQHYEDLRKVINQINIVLKKIIPDLEVMVNEVNQEMLDNKETGIRFEFLSKRYDLVLPLRCESSGVLKLISILSMLIAAYNNPNACIVIDELDSGVFEYLLGELIEIISESGKGQLLFTSHNLRVLEVLTHHQLWFTTTNEMNRFIKLSKLNSQSNIRDTYLRAVQLGGQKEELYDVTDNFDIKSAFREASVSDV